MPVANQMITDHKEIYSTYSVLAYINNFILFPNKNCMDFTTGTLVYLVEIIPGLLVISLGCTETCA